MVSVLENEFADSFSRNFVSATLPSNDPLWSVINVITLETGF